MIKILSLPLMVPCYLLGFCLGYLARPFKSGYTTGCNVLYNSEVKSVKAKWTERFQQKYAVDEENLNEGLDFDG